MDLENIREAIIEGDAGAAAEGVKAALEVDVPTSTILNEACIPAMDEVGKRFEAGEIYVPEMLIAARAMQAGMDILKPLLAEAGVEAAGTVVIGTVAGDLHDIGKNLVAMMLEGAGFEIIDLGTDVAPEVFVEAVREHQPDIVGMSALLTTTMPAMERTIQAFEEAGLRSSIKIAIGGAPVTPEFSEEIGADAYAPDAAAGVDTARGLVA